MEKQIVNRGHTLEYYNPEKVRQYLKRYIPVKIFQEDRTQDDIIEPIVKELNEYVELEEDITSEKIQTELFSLVEGRISAQESFWQNVAGCIKADINRSEVFNNRGFHHSLKELFELAHEHNQYTDFYKEYSEKELQELTDYIDYENDYNLNHIGAHIAYARYVTSIPYTTKVNNKKKSSIIKIETLQERYMAIAMFLLRDEENRIEKIKESYDKMSGNGSSASFTPATPTFMNAGRPDGNLSSCFIGMSDDSIEGIYNDVEQFAKISKNAGGYGSYWGKVRSIGSAIKGKPGMSSGSTPFMKLLDVTAGAVDQLG